MVEACKHDFRFIRSLDSFHILSTLSTKWLLCGLNDFSRVCECSSILLTCHPFSSSFPMWHRYRYTQRLYSLIRKYHANINTFSTSAKQKTNKKNENLKRNPNKNGFPLHLSILGFFFWWVCLHTLPSFVVCLCIYCLRFCERKEIVFPFFTSRLCDMLTSEYVTCKTVFDFVPSLYPHLSYEYIGREKM